MRKITKEMVKAYLNAKPYKKANTEVIVNHFANCGTLTQIFLHGNCIAQHDDQGLKISNCGWFTPTTKERLNALPNVNINQKNFKWYLNGKEWDGNWILIKQDEPVLKQLEKLFEVYELA